MADLTGQTIGRYQVTGLLGEGGMATVYKAFDTRLERYVAIKIIRRSAFGSEVIEQLLMRFEREAKSLARLSHPSIVDVYDFGEYDSSPYLVMEFVPGGNLKDRMGRAFPWPEAVRLLLPVARALAYAHQSGIVHRDVKPSNIMFTTSGDPMLADFGIAKLLGVEGQATLTGTGVGIGTPEYMAPEQGLGQAVDGRADEYGLGIVLYELVTGRRPFEADTPMAVILKHVTDPLPPPRQFAPDIPDEVEAVLCKALAKKPEDRYEDLGAFVSALEKLLSGRKEVEKLDRFTQPLVVNQATQIDQTAQKITASPTLAARPRPSRRWLLAFGIGGLVLFAALCSFAGYGVLTGSGLFGGLKAALAPAATSTLTPTPVSTSAPAASWTPSPTSAPTSTSTPEPTSTPFPFPYFEQTAIPSLAAISPENAAGIVQLARWGKGNVTGMAYSPDGKLLAVACPLGIYLYSADSLEAVRFIESPAHVRSVTFSPDGQTLASGSIDKIVRLWRVSDGVLLRSLEGYSDPVEAITFSPDGQTLASGSGDGTILIWQISGGLLLKLQGQSGVVTSLAFSPDGSILVSRSDAGKVLVWQVSSWRQFRILEDFYGAGLTSVAFSPNGGTLATGSMNGYVYLWRVSDWSLREKLEGHTNEVTSLAFSSDGQTLASGSVDKTVKLWRVSDRSLLYTLGGHIERVTGVAFAPDGQTLASGSSDGTLRLWKVSDGSLLRALEGHSGDFISVAVSPDGQMLASGSRGGTISLWRVSDGSLLRTLEGHVDGVNGLAFSPDGQALASSSRDGTVRLWKVSDGTSFLRIVSETHSWLASVVFSPDGQTVAFGSGDAAIRLYRVTDASPLRTMKGQAMAVGSLAYSPDGQILASQSGGGAIDLWRVDNGNLLRTLAGSTGYVTALAFSPDGQILASGASDNFVRLWKVSDGSLLRTLEGHANGVNSVAFSPDGQTLVSGGWDWTIRLWRVSDGSLLKTLPDAVNIVTYSPDGLFLASGSFDGTIHIWGVPK